MIKVESSYLTPLISNQITSKRMPDEDFVTRIADAVINKLGLEYYVRDIRFRNQPWNGTGDIKCDYNFVSRILYINIRSCLEYFVYNAKYINIAREELLVFLIDNVSAMILHELEHANQKNKRDLNEDNLETLVLKASYVPRQVATSDALFDMLLEMGYTEREIYNFLAEKQQLYLKYHAYSPDERLAECYAHESMGEIFKKLGRYPNISNYECYMLYLASLRGYSEDIIPTKYYLDKLDVPDYWEEIAEASKGIDLNSRLVLGLEITDSEYIYLSNKADRLKARVLK